LDENKYDRQLRIWGEEGQKEIQNTNILLVGIGGTGSEILKNLLLLGFRKIYLVDLDKIEVSNLNRQFFYQEEDIGKYKAEVAAKKAYLLNPDANITYFNKKIQDIPLNIFEICDYYISALDNIPARLYLNQKSIEFNKPLLDCGTEGFIGHVQIVIPKQTPCLMCHNLWVPPEMNFKCSYAINPRTPLDCALEARDRFIINYNRSPDPDNPEDLNILLGYAQNHAKKFGIIGITSQTIKDSLKGTVASLVTINSIIGSVLVNELIKLIISKLPIYKKLELKTISFFQFNGKTEMGWTIPLQINKNCPVCGIDKIMMNINRDIPLIQFIQYINQKLNGVLRLPFLIYNDKIIYREKYKLIRNKLNKIQKDELERLLELELKPIDEIFEENRLIFIKDEESGLKFNLQIKYKN